MLPIEVIPADLQQSALASLASMSLEHVIHPQSDDPEAMYGIVGKPLSQETVRAIARLDEKTREAMSTLQAAVCNELPEDTIDAAHAGVEACYSTPMLASQAAEGLNALGVYNLVRAWRAQGCRMQYVPESDTGPMLVT